MSKQDSKTKLFVSPFVFFLQVWILMLALGGIHHDILPKVPALGFWGSALVLVVTSILFKPLASNEG